MRKSYRENTILPGLKQIISPDPEPLFPHLRDGEDEMRQCIEAPVLP